MTPEDYAELRAFLEENLEIGFTVEQWAEGSTTIRATLYLSGKKFSEDEFTLPE